eukprot:COSAG02_NODE_5760_length_4061_cov_7.851085_3_plen_133_part_00
MMATRCFGGCTVDDSSSLRGATHDCTCRFDATEVEDPNIVELPESAGGGSLLFFTGAWVSGDYALNCTGGDQPQPDSAKLAAAQRIGVAYRYGTSINQCECSVSNILFLNPTKLCLEMRLAPATHYSIMGRF